MWDRIPAKPQDGDLPTVDEFNRALRRMLSQFNGGLDRDNLAAGAVQDTQLAVRSCRATGFAVATGAFTITRPEGSKTSGWIDVGAAITDTTEASFVLVQTSSSFRSTGGSDTGVITIAISVDDEIVATSEPEWASYNDYDTEEIRATLSAVAVVPVTAGEHRFAVKVRVDILEDKGGGAGNRLVVQFDARRLRFVELRR